MAERGLYFAYYNWVTKMRQKVCKEYKVSVTDQSPLLPSNRHLARKFMTHPTALFCSRESLEACQQDAPHALAAGFVRLRHVLISTCLWFGKYDGIQHFLRLFDGICELVPTSSNQNDQHAFPIDW